jgi:hypothetical protein
LQGSAVSIGLECFAFTSTVAFKYGVFCVYMIMTAFEPTQIQQPQQRALACTLMLDETWFVHTYTSIARHVVPHVYGEFPHLHGVPMFKGSAPHGHEDPMPTGSTLHGRGVLHFHGAYSTWTWVPMSVGSTPHGHGVPMSTWTWGSHVHGEYSTCTWGPHVHGEYSPWSLPVVTML